MPEKIRRNKNRDNGEEMRVRRWMKLILDISKAAARVGTHTKNYDYCS